MRSIPLKLDEMEMIARDGTREALKDYEMPSEEILKEFLTLGSGYVNDKTKGIFELYLAAENPDDVVLLSKTLVDCYSGELDIEIFLPLKPKNA